MRDLKECREAIDRIDSDLLRLLKERLEVAGDIARYKLDHNQGIVDRARENAKLDSLARAGADLGISPVMITAVYKEIMAHTVSFEQSYIMALLNEHPLTRDTSIAYLGTQQGTYSHLAALRFTRNHQGHVTYKGRSSFEEIIAAVENGECEYALLPIENSSSGSINEVLDLISRTRAYIIGEVFLPIDHSVLALPDVRLSDITDLYSHPQPITQCSDFIKLTFPHATSHYTSSTSEAMQTVSELGSGTSAAIASRDSARLFNLVSLKDDIANHKNNYTRFVVLALTPVMVPQNLEAKTSLIFSVQKYAPGSLIAVLDTFSRNGINLIKLNSRPRESETGEIWEEIFFADVLAHLDTPVMQDILHKLKRLTSYLKVLGCYASSDRPVHEVKRA